MHFWVVGSSIEFSETSSVWSSVSKVHTIGWVRELLPNYIIANVIPCAGHNVFVLTIRFRYHILSEGGVSYVCVTELSYESRRAHEFLNQICSFFANSPLIKKAPFAQPYEFSSDLHQVLGQLMADYSSQQPASSKLDSVQGQVNEVKVILKDNINKVLERGERLDDLVDKTHDLQATADSFQRTSTRVARKYWWKNAKMMIIIGVIVLIILILIILFATGVIPS
ncbi:vesicle-associated membrane protein 714 isoform X1 [Salmo trutta]|nr:vesicle-associated membrane protein 714-like isoform X1 [Salmo trutta]